MRLQVNEKYELTDEHSSSSYNIPVLLDKQTGEAYSVDEVIGEEKAFDTRSKYTFLANPRPIKAYEIVLNSLYPYDNQPDHIKEFINRFYSTREVINKNSI